MNAPTRRKAIAAAVVILAAAVLVWLAVSGRSGSGNPQREPRTPPSEGTSAGAVTISRSSQENAGILTVVLKLVSHREEVRAYGTVLQANGLTVMRKDFAAARASLDRSSAFLEASRKEYERLKALYQDRGNVSEKALQAAEAKWRSDEAEVEGARVSLQAVRQTIAITWGKILARWLFDDSVEFRGLTGLSDVLIRITLPPDLQIGEAPQTIRVHPTGRSSLAAKLIGPAPSTDPRIQGMSFFYLAPTQRSVLLPGTNLIAILPAGPVVKGFMIPAEAVVWREGKAWCYLKKDTTRFVRRQVVTGMPVEAGYFVLKGFHPGDEVVVSGAQLLLSEEFRSVMQGGEDGDED